MIGGLAVVIWAVLGFIFGDYQAFIYENSLIRDIYTTRPPSDNDNPSDEKQAKLSMIEAVSKRGRFLYNYFDYRLMTVVTSRYFKRCCRCLHKYDWYWEKKARMEQYEEV